MAGPQQREGQPLLADAVAGCLLLLHLDVTVAVRGIQPFGLDAVRCNSNIGVSRAACDRSSTSPTTAWTLRRRWRREEVRAQQQRKGVGAAGRVLPKSPSAIDRASSVASARDFEIGEGDAGSARAIRCIGEARRVTRYVRGTAICAPPYSRQCRRARPGRVRQGASDMEKNCCLRMHDYRREKGAEA